MSTTRDKLRFPGPLTPSRDSLAAAVRTAESGMAVLRRGADRLFGRAELHLRAWREALDPGTAEWVAAARTTEPDKSAEDIRLDLERRIADASPQP